MPRLAKRTIPWSSLLPFVGAAAAIFSTCCRCDLLTLDKRGHTDEIQIRNLGRQDKDRTAVENLLEQARKMSARMYGNGSWEQVEATSQAFARALAADSLRMESMMSLLQFLLTVPEHARLNMAEVAVTALLDEGLVDSASCLMMNVAAAGPQWSSTTEAFYRRSLDIEPANPAVARSLGHMLQSQGRVDDALRLYDDHLRRNPRQPALYLTRASLCPHHFKSTRAACSWYVSVRNRLVDAVATLKQQGADGDTPRVEDLHVSLARMPGVGWQYLGQPMAPLVSLMNQALLVMDPDLMRAGSELKPIQCWMSVGDEIGIGETLYGSERREGIGNDVDEGGGFDGIAPSILSQKRSRQAKRIRLGIVMERRGNCSPERVFSAVLQKLDRSKFEVVIFAQDTPQAPAGEAMLAAADRVVLLPGYDGMASVGELTHPGGGGKLSLGVPNLHDSRKVIQAERLDCMLYLAMGSSLLQQLLSIGRLAPLQLSFGLGHPVTAGHPGMDYFVSSDLFEVEQEIDDVHICGCTVSTQEADSEETGMGTEGTQAAVVVATVKPSLRVTVLAHGMPTTAGNDSGGYCTEESGAEIDERRGPLSQPQQRQPEVCRHSVGADVAGREQLSDSNAGTNGTESGSSCGGDDGCTETKEGCQDSTARDSSAALYSEQVVLFDSFTGVFFPPRRPLPDRVRATRDRLLALAATAAPVPVAAATAVRIEESTGREWGQRHTSFSDISPEANAGQEEAILPTRQGQNGWDRTPVYSVHDVLGNREQERYGGREEGTAELNGSGRIGDIHAGGGHDATAEMNNDNDDGEIHLYHCLQDFKKFHPAFDVAMHGVLEQDPGARLLLSEAARVHLYRWNHTLSQAESPLFPAAAAAEVIGGGGWGEKGEGGLGGRLIFLPDMEHSEMMEVVAACDVMLAPWGWGAGITSFEALAVGVPVVTAPSEESILHFSRGQIAILGLEDELVGKDAQDYVSKAVRLATDRPFRDSVSGTIIDRRERLFSDKVQEETAAEWGNFIERALRMACPNA